MPRNPTSHLLTHAGISAEVTYKDIRHLRLRVLPPDGRVAVSVPLGVADKTVRAFIEERRGWIASAQQRVRLASPPDEPLVDGGRLMVWGRAREVRLVEGGRPGARLDGEVVRIGGPDEEARSRAVDRLLRSELEAALPRLLSTWQPRIGKEASRVRLRRMTTRWGTCNTVSGAITLNLTLAGHPPEAVEYVLVHELVHLWERGHGARFIAMMDRHLPDWRARRAALRGSS